jgi:hypothetical protein
VITVRIEADDPSGCGIAGNGVSRLQVQSGLLALVVTPTDGDELARAFARLKSS